MKKQKENPTRLRMRKKEMLLSALGCCVVAVAFVGAMYIWPDEMLVIRKGDKGGYFTYAGMCAMLVLCAAGLGVYFFYEWVSAQPKLREPNGIVADGHERFKPSAEALKRFESDLRAIKADYAERRKNVSSLKRILMWFQLRRDIHRVVRRLQADDALFIKR